MRRLSLRGRGSGEGGGPPPAGGDYRAAARRPMHHPRRALCHGAGAPHLPAQDVCPGGVFAQAQRAPGRRGARGGGGGEDDGRTTTATGRREATRRGGGRKPLPAGAAAGRGRRGPGGPPRSAWRRKAPLHRPPAAPSPPAVSRSAFAEGGGTGRPRRCVPPRRRERPGRYPEPRQRARGGGGTHADRPRDPPARRGSARSRPGPGCPASPWPRAGASRRRRAPPAGAASPAGAELPRPLPAGTRQRAEPRAPCAAAPRVRRRAQRDRPFRSAGTARRSFVGVFAEGGVAGGSRWREPCVSPRGVGGGSWAEPFCCCDFSSEVGKGSRTQLKRPGERLIGRRGLVLAALAASLSGCRYPFSPPRPVSPSLPPALRRRARFAERRLQNRSVGGQWARVGFCGVFF